ncbi:hypothetical protein ACEWY4_000464 [Coilia grayii]|uniref:Inactive polyglycylase TTLL10 n=1 Tax=Coilia grayii TaxID=363190 RepID=A0ABD1KX70_9TELE
MSLESRQAGSDSDADTLSTQKEDGDHTGRDHPPAPPPPRHHSSPEQRQAKSEAKGEEISGLVGPSSLSGDGPPRSGAAGKQQREMEALPCEALGDRPSRVHQRGEQVKRTGGGGPVDVCQLENNSGGNGRGTPRQQQQQSSRSPQCSDKGSDRRPVDPQGPGPFFFIGGGNGAPIVAAYCESKGWQRIHDKSREDYKLKWCETRSVATYYNFREGEQLVYQIPNNKVLTSKIGLLNSLREYDRVCIKVNQGRALRTLKMDEFFPDTFRMDVKDEREAFFAQQERACERSSSSVWICKPTCLNQGRGIFLLRSPEEISAFRVRLQHSADKPSSKLPFRLPQARIVQKYVQNPLLLKGRKFDVRSYLLIASTTPYMVFFRHGYVRLTCDLYDPNSENLSAHLTNQQYMQKKNPLYSLLKEETVWSIERFNEYVNDNFQAKGLPKDWVQGVFTRRMQQIMLQCFMAVKAKLARKLGFFDLIGCDFLIDEDFKVWLLEMNCNPALHTNCKVLKEVVPHTVTETLGRRHICAHHTDSKCFADLALEIFEKCRCRMKLMPLASQKDFVTLYRGDEVPTANRRSKTTQPLQLQQPPKTSTAQRSPGPRTQRSAAVVSTSSGEKPTCAGSASLGCLDTSANPSYLASFATLSSLSPQDKPPGQQASSAAPHPSGTALVAQRPQAVKPCEPPPRVYARPRRPAPVRVVLRLKKCTWQERSPTPTQDAGAGKRTILSLSMPLLTKATPVPKRCPTPYPKQTSEET